MRPLAAVHLTLTLPGGDAQELQELGEFSPSGNDMGFSTEVYVPRGNAGGQFDGQR